MTSISKMLAPAVFVCSFFGSQALALDVDSSYQTTWFDPHQRNVLTAERGPLKAELTVNQPIFSGGPDRSIGGLKIRLDNKVIYEDRYPKDQRLIDGPWLSDDESSPTIFVELMRPDSPGDYSESQKVFAYKVNSDNNWVSKTVATTYAIDTKQANEKTMAIRDGEYGGVEATLSSNSLSTKNLDGWQLVISKGNKKLLAENPVTPDVSSNEERWNPPRCHGPFVTSLNNDGKVQVVLMFETVMDKPGGCYTVYSQKIYYIDEAGEVKSTTTSFGAINPRFVSIGQPSVLRLISEDWSLARDIWEEDPGPLQIWKWDKNKLVNVTKEYPEEIKKHKDGVLARYNQDKSSCWLLGYIGDLLNLGEKDKAFSELEAYKTQTTEKYHDRIIEQLKQHGYM